MQIAYNQGNDMRHGLAEILKAGIESVNPAFNVQVIAMPWPVLLNSRRPAEAAGLHRRLAGGLPRPAQLGAPLPALAGQLTGGWSTSNLAPRSWRKMFDALINEAAALTRWKSAARSTRRLQLKAQEEAVILWGYQEIESYHYQHGSTDMYFNSAFRTRNMPSSMR